jgi:hypothetical protein
VAAIGKKAGWALEPVCVLWRGDELCCCQGPKPGRTALGFTGRTILEEFRLLGCDAVWVL